MVTEEITYTPGSDPSEEKRVNQGSFSNSIAHCFLIKDKKSLTDKVKEIIKKAKDRTGDDNFKETEN